jgi:hypothetical protein
MVFARREHPLDVSVQDQGQLFYEITKRKFSVKA